MNRGSDQFQALEETWRKRVVDARERYLAVVAEPASDHELRRAARAEYMRLLRVFSDLVMKGQIPPEDE
jgi:predicted aminopeptidase